MIYFKEATAYRCFHFIIHVDNGYHIFVLNGGYEPYWDYHFDEELKNILKDFSGFNHYNTNLSYKEKERLKSALPATNNPVTIAKLRFALKDIL